MFGLSEAYIQAIVLKKAFLSNITGRDRERGARDTSLRVMTKGLIFVTSSE